MPEVSPVSRTRLAQLGLFISLFAGAAAAQDPPSEETVRFFRQNCASCHTVGGGRLTGPDLKDVSERAERDWLMRFIVDPRGVIDSGDLYAQKILSEARGVYMTPVPGMDAELAGKLLDLIDVESTLEKSRFAGIQLSERPLTERDVELGRALFLGERELTAGGPACISCHSAPDLGGFGGGRLGPDLTAVYGRLEGRKALGAWLASPPSLVMQPLYMDHPLESEEILSLVAFLKEGAETGQAETEPNVFAFVLSGIGVAAALMVLFDVAWRSRFRSVRRTLVARS
jgi:mono/diheme cytochrome c family protein